MSMGERIRHALWVIAQFIVVAIALLLLMTIVVVYGMKISIWPIIAIIAIVVFRLLPKTAGVFGIAIAIIIACLYFDVMILSGLFYQPLPGTPSKQNEDYYGKEYPFYKPGDLDKGIDICDSVDGLSQKGYDASRKIKANSVLVTCIGATIGKTGLISKDGACNQQINAIIPVNSLLPKYVYYTICSPTLQSIIRKDAGQTTLPIMNKNTFCKLLFPLPPLAEQKRIVAKIEQLLGEIEKLKK